MTLIPLRRTFLLLLALSGTVFLSVSSAQGATTSPAPDSFPTPTSSSIAAQAAAPDVALGELLPADGWVYRWEQFRLNMRQVFAFRAEQKAALYEEQVERLNNKLTACSELGDTECLKRVQARLEKLQEKAEDYVTRREALREKFEARLAAWREKHEERIEMLQEKAGERQVKRQELYQERKAHMQELRVKQQEFMEERQAERQEFREKQQGERKEFKQDTQEQRKDVREELQAEKQDLRQQKSQERPEQSPKDMSVKKDIRPKALLKPSSP